MALMASKDEDMALVRGAAETVLSACEEVMCSAQLRLLLQQVLAAGNAVNKHRHDLQAGAIKISSLPKIAEVRSFDNKVSLLEAVLEAVTDKLPALMPRIMALKAVVEAASKVQLSGLLTKVEELEQGCRSIEALLPKLRDGLQPGDAARVCGKWQEQVDGLRLQLAGVRDLVMTATTHVAWTAQYFSGIGPNVRDPVVWALSGSQEMWLHLDRFLQQAMDAHHVITARKAAAAAGSDRDRRRASRASSRRNSLDGSPSPVRSPPPAQDGAPKKPGAQLLSQPNTANGLKGAKRGDLGSFFLNPCFYESDEDIEADSEEQPAVDVSAIDPSCP